MLDSNYAQRSDNNYIGYISKITGSKVLVHVGDHCSVNKVEPQSFTLRYLSIGSLIGTKLVDSRTLVLSVEEILDNDPDVIITASISGIYDSVTEYFSFGTNTYPLIDEEVFVLKSEVLKNIFRIHIPEYSNLKALVGTYAYDSSVTVGYNPNVLFGKHLGVFGNTGSGKTCTVISLIQQFIRTNPEKNIKFIILDVNGEYRSAFRGDECEYIRFDDLRFHHTILDNSEYGRLFRAAEGIQYPALKSCIRALKSKAQADNNNELWDLELLPYAIDSWVEQYANDDIKVRGQKDKFSINQLSGYMRTLSLRVEEILNDDALLKVINSEDEKNTIEFINKTDKKVFVLDLEVSSDSLDVVLYMLFKTIYLRKVEEKKNSVQNRTHLCLVLEEAHRYINSDADDSKLGSYYIDKLSREGRKFEIGLIISSQVPSKLSYDIVSQCNSVIMHKITNRRDMEFLRGVLRISSDSMFHQMSALEKQYAIVCGEAFPNDALVRINDAAPLPDSNDPVIEDVVL